MSASDRPSEVTVLLARRATSVRLVDVLRDWSSLDLVNPVHVIDLDAAAAADVHLPSLLIDRGRVRAVSLQDELAEMGSVDRVRVCAVGEAADVYVSPTLEECTRIGSVITSAAAGAQLTKVRAVGVAVKAAAPTGRLAWHGWHNLVIAPENSAGPSSAIAPVVLGEGADVVRRTHLAASLVSLLGLWSGQKVCPFDERPLMPGELLTASRSFVRHLSAGEVEDDLLGVLTDVSHGYPVPLYDGRSTWVVEDEVFAASQMVNELFARHPEMGRRPRPEPVAASGQRIGFWQAFGLLFRFLGAALRNAPRRFLDYVAQRGSIAAAGLAQSVVFGSSTSEYTVIVNGVCADGMPSSWEDIDRAASRVTDRLGSARTRAVAADFSSFWRDFVSAGLTLLDAGTRVPELPPRMEGGNRAVISTAARVSPDSRVGFEPLPIVAPFCDIDASAVDVLAARDLYRRLGQAKDSHPHAALEIGRDQERLKGWGQENERSYVGGVGGRIAEELRAARDELGDIVRRLEAARTAMEMPSEIENDQKRLSSRLRLACLLLALGLVGTGALVAGPATWVEGLVLALLMLLTWLVVSTVVFMRGQKRLFALIHERERNESQVRTLTEHLHGALEDIRRLARGYRQFLDWGQAFGQFVHQPLGGAPQRTQSNRLIGTGLPRNVRFGRVQPQRAVIEEVAVRLRRELFSVGWAGQAWEDYLADLPPELGADRYRLSDDMTLLWVDPGAADRSLLSAWSRAVCSRPTPDSPTAMLQHRVDEALARPGADYTSRLLAQVRTRSVTSGAEETLDHSTFLGQLEGPDADLAGASPFTRDFFAPVPETQNPWTVEAVLAPAAARGLTKTLVLTQLSRAFHPYDLVVDESDTSGSVGSWHHTADRPLM